MAAAEVAPLIVIGGPTASGKTALAIRLAKKYNGEIICADSRTIYKGMDIGTAKPTLAERQIVPHWGLDLVGPGQVFSAAQFKAYAQQKIKEIRQRGKVPFLVGGTGLYLDAVVFDFQFGAASDSVQRERLMAMSADELIEYCYNHNIKLPQNTRNKRYVVRAIERCGSNISRQLTPDKTTIVVGIATDKQALRQRITVRAQQLFASGMIEEAIALAAQYGWESEAMTGNIYPLVRQYIRGKINNDELVRQFIVSDWRLAKRQMTWLRRNPYVMWVDLGGAEHYLSQILADYHSL
ncbi:MAG: tRNA (adenosine(37)-N6)-dimethylallyltransferase MiaA [Candidatus Saccharibacteria bacterium]|nr:tRNA (adenosine(37)-N6)-dimethylallyltransferase MiaA [Candidatus Saccharibacteria bacterium]